MHEPLMHTAAFDESKIDAIFAELDQCHLPGAAVGIAIGGQPVYRKGFGLASMELPIMLSPTIRMRIGSTTKHFTCLAYMLLCEEGRAGIDDPVDKHLPELHLVAHQVTMRQLMGHVSGLRDAHAIAWLFSGMERPVPSDVMLSLYHSVDDVHSAPGTAWMYNNGGYLLLTSAIERIAGQSFEQVLRERIFVPVGMYETMVRRSDDDIVANSAALHAMKRKRAQSSSPTLLGSGRARSKRHTWASPRQVAVASFQQSTTCCAGSPTWMRPWSALPKPGRY